MKFGVLCFALMGLVVLNSGKMMAQDDPLAPQQKSVPFYIGPVAGVNIVNHSTELTLPGELVEAGMSTSGSSTECPTINSASAIGYYVGISMEYFFGGPVNSNSSLIAKVVYNSMPANAAQLGVEYSSLGADNLPFKTNVDFVADVALNMITLEALYKLNFLDRFGATVGLNLDYILTAHKKSQLDLVSSDPNVRFKADPTKNYVYENNQRTLIINDKDLDDKSAMRIALKFGLQYEIEGGKGIVIVPNVNYNFGLNSINSNKDWTVSAIQAGVDVRFALGGN